MERGECGANPFLNPLPRREGIREGFPIVISTTAPQVLESADRPSPNPFLQGKGSEINYGVTTVHTSFPSALLFVTLFP
jgi:hypothetical protein